MAGAIASARATIGITAAYRAKLLRLEFSCQKKRAPATKKRDGGSGGGESRGSENRFCRQDFKDWHDDCQGVERREGWGLGRGGIKGLRELRESGARTVLG